jgi:hypothetical protein
MLAILMQSVTAVQLPASTDEHEVALQRQGYRTIAKAYRYSSILRCCTARASRIVVLCAELQRQSCHRSKRIADACSSIISKQKTLYN